MVSLKLSFLSLLLKIHVKVSQLEYFQQLWNKIMNFVDAIILQL